MFRAVTKKNIMREGLWTTFGKVTAALGTLAGVRMLTEFIPTDVYGTVSLLIGMMTLCINLFAAPILLATQRFHSEAVRAGTLLQFRTVIGDMLKPAIWAPAILLLAGGVVYAWQRPLSYLVFPALVAFLAVQVLRNLETCLLSAARRQKETAIWDAAEAWFKPVFALLAVILVGARPDAVIFGYFFAVGGALLCVHRLPVLLEGRSGSDSASVPDRQFVADIRSYALPLVPLALVGWVLTLSDRYIIGGLLGTGEVGIYAATYGLIGMPFLIVGGTINQTLRPVFFQAVTAGNRALQRKMLFVWVAVTTLLCCAGVAAVYVLKDYIVALLLAREYRSGAVLMPWIAAGIGLQVVSQIFENILMAYKKTRQVLLVHTAGASVCVVTVFLFIKGYGLIGAAMACPAYYLSMVIVGMYLVVQLKNTRLADG